VVSGQAVSCGFFQKGQDLPGLLFPLGNMKESTAGRGRDVSATEPDSVLPLSGGRQNNKRETSRATGKRQEEVSHKPSKKGRA